MPFPSGYERKFGFEGFQDTHPSTPLPGTQVDVELDGVAKSTAALVAFLQKFTRADGKLANGSVGVDQLAADFKVGFKAPTTWEPGIMYVLADTVFEGTGFFTCIAPHTSGSSFESEYWSLILDFGSSAQAAAASAAVAQAAAAAAATVDGMFSAPVLSITGTPSVSPATGDRYLVAASGTTGVFVGKENQVALWSGAWVFSGAPKSGQILFNTGVGYAYKFDGTSWLRRRSKLAFVSDFATFSAALAFAAAASARLVVDDDRTLAANTSISASIPAVSFESGKLTLGVYDLTFNGHPVRAEAEQIFNSASTGKVKGTINGPICIDWWGTTSASTADAATTNAGNDCLAHVRQSDIPRNDIYCTKSVYYQSGPWVLAGGKSSVGPKLDGHGATIINSAATTGVAAIVWTGDSGSTSNGVIKNFRFRGNTVSWGIEVRGACWAHLENIEFQDNETGLVLHNKDASTYTEFVTWSHCTFACNRAWYFKRTAGDGSFHGSGPVTKNIVNYVVGASVSPVKLDAGAIVYNAPFDCSFFPNTAAVPLVEAAGAACYLMTYGDITLEKFWASGALSIAGGAGTYAACTHNGSISVWGGGAIQGKQILMQTVSISGGVVSGVAQGKIFTANMGSGSATCFIGGTRSQNYSVEVFINLAGYFWSGTILVAGDGFGNYDAYILRTHTSGGASYGAWGAPTPSWNGSTITLSNANYVTTSNAVTLGVTDSGYTS